MQEYQAMWMNFANFRDRTSVRGYWMATLFNAIADFILYFIGSIISGLYFLYGIYSLAALIPGLALTVRRLRDAGKPWWCMFLVLIPVVGGIVLIVLLCQPTSNTEGNQV